MSDRYVIHWMAKRTGNTGQGTGQFTKDDAQRWADQMNEEHRGLLVFWIELVTPDQEPTQPAGNDG